MKNAAGHHRADDGYMGGSSSHRRADDDPRGHDVQKEELLFVFCPVCAQFFCVQNKCQKN